MIKKQKQTTESWYLEDVICCPKCGHLQQDYINESDVGVGTDAESITVQNARSVNLTDGCRKKQGVV